MKVKRKDNFIKNSLSAIVFPLAIINSFISLKEKRVWKPKGSLVNLETQSMHAYITGTGKPKVILEAAIFSELDNTEMSVKQLKLLPPIPDQTPITVLSAGKQTEQWKAQQAALRTLNKNTKQKVIEDSWHSIQIHKPEEVIHIIKEMICSAEDKGRGA